MMEQIMSFFVSSAYAEDMSGAPAQQGGGLSFVLMFAIFFVFLYFMVWRPQSKRAKEQQNLLNSLAKGDEVMTAGGLIGKIAKLTDQYIALSVSDSVELVLQRSSVVSILPKGTIKSIV